jgi:hypothetical protein
MEIKYPEIKVKLNGTDGNAFAILSRVNEAMRKAHIFEAEREVFYKDATSGDYDHLLQTCMKWVDVR